jgi:hypothetical protein
MSEEEVKRLREVFKRFSTDYQISGGYRTSVGTVECYQGQSRLMDSTAFVLAVMEFNRSAETVSGDA